MDHSSKSMPTGDWMHLSAAPVQQKINNLQGRSLALAGNCSADAYGCIG
jgi:hypothetical protein